LIEGGINNIELTFTVKYAPSILERLSIKYGDSVNIGAGSILDGESARTAILSGACFLVSPNFSENMIKTANRYKILTCCGVATASEAVTACEDKRMARMRCVSRQ
jgi:2-dehydro-3-deoxyphosphogluconate aldolase/(4S)-4-hydroxy-2-oxoglutarate aldolase